MSRIGQHLGLHVGANRLDEQLTNQNNDGTNAAAKKKRPRTIDTPDGFLRRLFTNYGQGHQTKTQNDGDGHGDEDDGDVEFIPQSGAQKNKSSAGIQKLHHLIEHNPTITPLPSSSSASAGEVDGDDSNQNSRGKTEKEKNKQNAEVLRRLNALAAVYYEWNTTVFPKIPMRRTLLQSSVISRKHKSTGLYNYLHSFESEKRHMHALKANQSKSNGGDASSSAVGTHQNQQHHHSGDHSTATTGGSFLGSTATHIYQASGEGEGESAYEKQQQQGHAATSSAAEEENDEIILNMHGNQNQQSIDDDDDLFDDAGVAGGGGDGYDYGYDDPWAKYEAAYEAAASAPKP